MRVEEERLKEFMRTAQTLQVRGLCDGDNAAAAAVEHSAGDDDADNENVSADAREGGLQDYRKYGTLPGIGKLLWKGTSLQLLLSKEFRNYGHFSHSYHHQDLASEVTSYSSQNMNNQRNYVTVTPLLPIPKHCGGSKM